MKKTLVRRLANRVFHRLARSLPGATTLRPLLHRWRGVNIGRAVFIGDDVYLDNEYPECIEIDDGAQISVRAIIVAHTRGPGKVIIGEAAFIGPNCVLACGAGRTLRVGEGAVVSAGSVVTRSIPPRLYVSPPALRAIASVRVPLPLATTMEEFRKGLVGLEREDSQVRATTRDVETESETTR